MPRFLFAVVAALSGLVPALALGQEVPDGARMDLWCGTAFELMTRDAPTDATAEKLAAAKVYADGAKLLIERALPIYYESGYSDETLATYRAKLEASVDKAINGTGGANVDAEYSFQDCSALIGQ